jgi:hypothetical protein
MIDIIKQALSISDSIHVLINYYGLHNHIDRVIRAISILSLLNARATGAGDQAGDKPKQQGKAKKRAWRVRFRPKKMPDMYEV